MEIADIRRRLRGAIEKGRENAAARRSRTDEAQRSYVRFLESVATPLFRQFANALQAEGYVFRVFTPAGGLRLSSERSTQDFIELALDTAGDPPAVVVRTSRGRGSRVQVTESPLREDRRIDELTEDDVLDALVREIPPFVDR
jgi:hypothetical protein